MTGKTTKVTTGKKRQSQKGQGVGPTVPSRATPRRQGGPYGGDKGVGGARPTKPAKPRVGHAAAIATKPTTETTGAAKKPAKAKPATKVTKASRKPTAGRTDAGKARGDPAKLTTVKYNILWEEYCEHQSIKKCAKAAGIKYETARKYITGDGRPEDGLMSIRARYLTAMAEAQAEQEQTLAEWQAEQVKDMKRIVRLHIAEFAVIQKHAAQRIKRYEEALKGEPFALPELEVSIDRLSQSLERSVRLTEHLLGGSDLTIEHKQHSQFAGWTEQEKMDYATKGILPEHAR